MKTNNHKFLKVVLVTLVCLSVVLSALALCACEKEYNLEVSVSHTLYEYDASTETPATTAKEDNIVKCGAKYKLVFDVNFTNLDILEKDINVTMTVNMGSYDNNKNKEHLLSSKPLEDGSSVRFESTGEENEYRCSFDLRKADKNNNDDKNTTIDFSKLYFIVGIDSLGTDPSTTKYQPVSVEFKESSSNYTQSNNSKEPSGNSTAQDKPKEPSSSSTEQDKSKEPSSSSTEPNNSQENQDKSKVKFFVNSGNGYYVSLTPIKGNLAFSNSNLSKDIGINAVKHNLSVSIPDNCGQINVAFYKDSGKLELYGEHTYDEDNNSEDFTKRKLSLLLADMIIQHVGQARYDEWTNGDQKFTVHIVITAVGGSNYNDAVVEIDYDFD